MCGSEQYPVGILKHDGQRQQKSFLAGFFDLLTLSLVLTQLSKSSERREPWTVSLCLRAHPSSFRRVPPETCFILFLNHVI